VNHIVKETFRDIVVAVTTDHKPTLTGLFKRDELMQFSINSGRTASQFGSLNMINRCSLLIAFLFCMHHVRWLEAIGGYNWSSIFNNNPSKNWVVLVAGSNTWENYRHQADVYRAYQLVRRNNVPAQNIITFAYDDIANNPKNPFKGRVFQDYQHRDVYNGVVIDYRGKEVNRDYFVKVLTGDKKLEASNKKVLKSGPNDNVFIFFSGHGSTSLIAFQDEVLHAMELNDTLAYMHSKKMFNKLVLYVEACYSGSMFKDVLSSNMGIYVTTSAKEDEESSAIYCQDKDIDVCLADEYSYAWLLDSEYEDIKTRTLEEQYEEVKRLTVKSHVMEYGEMAMGILPVGKFQGHYNLLVHRNDGAIAPNAVDKKPSCQANLFSKSRRLMEAANEEEHEIAWQRLQSALQVNHIVKETFRDIVVAVTTDHKPTLTGLSKRDELMCFQAVPEVAQYTTFLMELCKAGYEAETLIDSVHSADVYRAYQLVRRNNVPAQNIITFAYDDIANNPKQCLLKAFPPISSMRDVSMKHAYNIRAWLCISER
ncbi:hypothetical protein T265_15407, partial [Opisthorchis viverrini]